MLDACNAPYEMSESQKAQAEKEYYQKDNPYDPEKEKQKRMAIEELNQLRFGDDIHN